MTFTDDLLPNKWSGSSGICATVSAENYHQRGWSVACQGRSGYGFNSRTLLAKAAFGSTLSNRMFGDVAGRNNRHRPEALEQFLWITGLRRPTKFVSKSHTKRRISIAFNAPLSPTRSTFF
jgi:hypothetical protein